MRINIVMGFFLPVPPLLGGATEKIWLRVAQGMAAAGHDVTVLSREWTGLPSTEQTQGLRHLRFRGWTHSQSLPVNLWHDARWGWRLARRLPAADITVCNTVSLPIYLRRLNPAAGRVAVVLGRMPKGQVRCYGGADLLLATSQAVAARALHENPSIAGKIVRFANPIDWTLHAEAARTKGETPLIISYVGRIHPEKGLEKLLEASARLASQVDLPPWRLRFVGPVTVAEGGGGEAYLAALRRAYGATLGDRWDVLGPVYNPSELAHHYAATHIFCYPSLAAKGEGLSIGPLEAMAAGAVPVVSRLDCYRDVIRDGVNGLQFEQTSLHAAEELGRALESILRNPTLRSRLAAQAQQDARGYDYEATVRQLLNEFARLTGMPDRG